LAGRLRTACTTSLLPLLLLLAPPAAVRAQFYYVSTNGTITITGYAGPGGDVTIPDTINGLPVTCIGDGAFYNGGRPQPYTLTSITIPDSVISIGGAAFAWWGSLRSVTLGNGLRSIGAVAFADCGLTTITIPSGVTNIGDAAFAYSLATVYFLGNAPSLGGPSVFGGFGGCPVVFYLSGTTGWGPTFGGCPTALCVWLPDTYTTNNGTITITGYTGPGGAVTIPSTINGSPVTSIGYGAFAHWTSLTSVTIPNSVTDIESSAFAYCTSLTSVYFLGNAPSTYGTDVFDYWYFWLYGVVLYVWDPATIYYLAGTTGWGTTFGGRPTALWDPLVPFNYETNNGTITITKYTGPGGAVTIPSTINGLPVTSIGDCAFCGGGILTSVTIPDSVTSAGNDAFAGCTSLTSVYFLGNAPSLGGENVFLDDNNATVYYLAGTTGWGTTFGGRPTALWNPPTIQTSPQTQTAEAGSAVDLRVEASSSTPLFCRWYLNYTNLLSCGTNQELELTNVQFAQSGAYTVVVTNVLGVVTSAPAMLNVIAPVERRPVPGVKVTGEAASLLNVDYASSLSATPNWLPLDTVTLASTSQYYFDVSQPLPPQRYYRAWQTGTPSVIPSLSLLGIVPAITLTGSIGHSVRLDYINQFGPTDAWVTLATVTLTNTLQLYFDTSARGQPDRLYRLVQVP
jgi:hypothetical protein